MSTNRAVVQSYLDFALLQLGAESYLHGLPSFADQARIVERWKFGFNDPTHPFIIERATAGPDTPTLPAYNRMEERQAIDLFTEYYLST